MNWVDSHKEGGPAFVSYYNDDGATLHIEEWWLDDKLHRTDGPAHIEYNKTGTLRSEEWYINDELHRTDGPAHIRYGKGGRVWIEEWALNGIRCRVDGPARVQYNENGSIHREGWWNDRDTLHRTDGPAHIEYDDLGKLMSEEWYFEGQQHRLDGPACIKYLNGKIAVEGWFINGRGYFYNEIVKICQGLDPSSIDGQLLLKLSTQTDNDDA